MIHVENRVLHIPPSERIIGAKGESGVQVVQFSLKRYQEGVDLWPLTVTVEVEDEATRALYYDMAQKRQSADNLIISWAIGRHNTSHAGNKRINLRFMDSEAHVVWKSLMGFVTVADAVCAEEGWDENDTPPSVLEQAVASCTASTVKAEAAAAAAHSEAQRAAAIDAYTKGAADSRFGAPLTGHAAGERIHLTDAAAGYGLAKAVFYGETTESGHGNKSPTNPYVITGQMPTYLHANGKNVLDINAIMQMAINSGGTAELVTHANEKAAKLKLGLSADGQVIPLYCLPGPYTIAYRYYTDDAERWGFRFNILYTDGTTTAVMPTKFKSWDTVTVTSAADKTISGLSVVLQTSTIAQYIALSSQIEQGTAATQYEPYAGAHYAMPSMPPLMSIGDVKDSYNVLDGVETRRIGRMELVGTENFRMLDVNCNAESNLYYLSNIPIGGSYTMLCTHLLSGSIVPAANTNNGIYGNPAGRMFYFRIRLDTGITNVTEVKAWMAAQKAAGKPVTIFYEMEDTEIIEHQPQYIKQPASNTTLVADTPIEADYTQDANIVIRSLMEEIAELKSKS